MTTISKPHLGYLRRIGDVRLEVGVIHDEGQHLLGDRGLGVRVRVLSLGGAGLLLALLSADWLLGRGGQGEGDGRRGQQQILPGRFGIRTFFGRRLWFGRSDDGPRTARGEVLGLEAG